MKICLVLLACAYQTQGYLPSRVSRNRVSTRTAHRIAKRSSVDQFSSEKSKCNPCVNPLDNDDAELDRREAIFAMMGTVWAAGALPTALVFPEAANAASGDEAKIVLPNPIEGLYERSTKQCIQESLGNRECLVYAGEGETLFKGIDNKVLLTKIESASKALATVPDLIADKKWSKVTGVMTGPMGELTLTMVQLAGESSNSDAAKAQIKVVKTDLFAIQAAVQRKEGDSALKYHTAATKDLIEFIKMI